MEIFFTELGKIESLKDKCKYILLYTADLVTNNKKSELEFIINDDRLAEFHPSCLYSIILVSRNYIDKPLYDMLDNLYKRIAENYK